MKTVSKQQASHIVGVISGVKEGDSKRVAAQKAIDMMKLAGFPKREIAKAEAMLARAIAEGRA